MKSELIIISMSKLKLHLSLDSGCTPTALSVVRDVVFDPAVLAPAAADLRRMTQSEPLRVDPSVLNPVFQGDIYHDHFAFRTFGVSVRARFKTNRPA